MPRGRQTPWTRERGVLRAEGPGGRQLCSWSLHRPSRGPFTAYPTPAHLLPWPLGPLSPVAARAGCAGEMAGDLFCHGRCPLGSPVSLAPSQSCHALSWEWHSLGGGSSCGWGQGGMAASPRVPFSNLSCPLEPPWAPSLLRESPSLSFHFRLGIPASPLPHFPSLFALFPVLPSQS